MFRTFCLIISLIFPTALWAMPVKTQLLRPKAYFVEAENNLLEPLDLKAKTVTFSRAEFDRCGATLVRQALTLAYSCALQIPTKARISRLQNVVTPQKIEVTFGGSKRNVAVQVSADARTVTLTTEFDKTGIDFEISKFNDDFFAIYAKVAQLVISEALHKQTLRLEVLESHTQLNAQASPF